MSFKPFSLLIKGTLHTFERPAIMGILNLTPDSFYAQSRLNEEALLSRVQQMIHEGADILDIGGQSTRPGAERLTSAQEWERLDGVFETIHHHFPNVITSIDTFYGEVAQKAIARGAGIINDVSAGSIDPSIIDVAVQQHVPYVVMHMQGEPQTMQLQPEYKDVVQELIYFFSEKINELHGKGLVDLILDPGFGFGKKREHNYEILAHIKSFDLLNKPMLIGVSRKKMIQLVTEKGADGALAGTISANTFALLNGASILRVHDVAAAADARSIVLEIIKHQ
jgi:dihydropteroate synthase